jgi:FtsZ-interacting cell division protein ZipA
VLEDWPLPVHSKRNPVTTFIVIAVIALVVIGVAAYVIRQRNRGANIARAEQLRTEAASRAQSTLPPTQERAAEAEARAEEARAAAQRAQAEAEEARVAAAQAEALHEGQVRAADRLDPRVDHRADDYSPQVGGTVDQRPTPPAEVNAEPQPEPGHATEQNADGAPPLPRRTRGAQEMPGKPIEKTDGGGGWFTRKDPNSDRD